MKMKSVLVVASVMLGSSSLYGMDLVKSFKSIIEIKPDRVRLIYDLVSGISVVLNSSLLVVDLYYGGYAPTWQADSKYDLVSNTVTFKNGSVSGEMLYREHTPVNPQQAGANFALPEASGNLVLSILPFTYSMWQRFQQYRQSTL